MKKKMWIIILFFCLMFCGCGKKEAETALEMQNEIMAYETTECDIPQIIGSPNDMFRVASKVHIAVYTKRTPVKDGRYSVITYDMTDGSTQQTILQGKEDMALCRISVLENGNYKALFVVWDVETASCTSLILQIFDSQGNLLEEQDITKQVNETVDDTVFPFSYLLDREGNLYFYTEKINASRYITVSKLYCLNPQGEVKLLKEWEGKVVALDNVAGKVWLATKDTNDEVSFFKLHGTDADVESMDFTWSLSCQNFEIVEGVTENQKFIIQYDSVYEFDATLGETRLLFTYEDVGLESGSINTFGLFPIGQNEICTLSKMGENENGVRIYQWLKLVKTASASRKEILTIAVEKEDSFLKEAVTAFNKSSDVFKVEIKVYEKDIKTNQSPQLLGDIAAGKIPDMISTDLMELELLINKGMAHDLTGFLEADDELSKDAFVGRSLEIYQRGNKTYSIPSNIGVLALTGKQKVLQGRSGWTMQEFEKFADSLQNPSAITTGISKNEMLQAMMEMYLFRFVDWEKRTCTFESKEFVDLLQFVNKYPVQSLNAENDSIKFIDALQTDEIILYPGGISDIAGYQYLKNMWGDEIQWVGFPTETGSGIQLLDMKSPFIISESSSHKEEMWQILKYMITNPKLAEYCIPAYKPLFEKACSLAMEKSMTETEDGSLKEQPKLEYTFAGLHFVIYALTEEEVMEIKGLLEVAEPTKSSSQVIENIIFEESYAYFSGQKSVEEVSEIIQNRVSIYLDEM